MKIKKIYIDKMVEELKVSLEEAEAMYERGDDLHSPEEKAKDDTNFPSPGRIAVRISNSKYKQFLGYAKDLKEN